MNKLKDILEDISAALLVFVIFIVFVLGVVVGMFDRLWIYLIIGVIFIIVVTMFVTFKKAEIKQKKEIEEYEKTHKE